MKLGKLIVTALVVEALGVVLLVMLVAIAGPSDPSGAQEYAAQLGMWVGPLAGFFFCLGGGWWVARGLSRRRVVNGLALGALVAAIDLALLFGSGAAFHPVFVVSNVGRLLAGSLGGWFAGRDMTSPAEPGT